jgi:hypothetical protein
LLKVKELAPPFEPSAALASYEDASVNAYKSVWGDSVAVKVCCFHYSQAVIKMWNINVEKHLQRQ